MPDRTVLWPGGEQPQLPDTGNEPSSTENAKKKGDPLAQASSRPSGRPRSCYTPRRWTLYPREMAELADRMFCIQGEPAKGREKAEVKMQEAQRKLEAY
jgi:hypothetical protein